ncbi:uncharacterized mitochondrial protein AtMg00860-like [Beta vulgaris subsp. vulgaris]|uniref:uncharacterized mitochondrial protein AtMg00860-like n=1 Tax=Beta vulgaris subsp. vulgaris TaxID=3555 RepID=UPI00090061E6|nr:uncharacterized mitochondrial protein AtMg00860-like [Beta vulgaris subsp. vulgaris]
MYKYELGIELGKCHFMVEEGIVLGHMIFSRGIEVDPAKVETIKRLPPPTNVRGVRSFLGHAGFCRRFIKGFSQMAKPLTKLLAKDSPFVFTNDCLQAFDRLKVALVSAPIMQPPYWELPFELMCVASDVAVGAVLGQRNENKLHAIYYVRSRGGSRLWLGCSHHAGADFAVSSLELPLLTRALARLGQMFWMGCRLPGASAPQDPPE